MKNTNQSQLAESAGISEAMLSFIKSGKKRAGWKTAKRLAAITKTSEALWLDGEVAEIQTTIISFIEKQRKGSDSDA